VPNAIRQDAYVKEVSILTGIAQPAIKAEMDKLSKAEDFKWQHGQTKKFVRPTKTAKPKGFEAAQKGILKLLAKDKNIYLSLKDVLTPQEFADAVYVKLAQLIYRAHETERDVYPAEVLNHFETSEEQQLAGEVFAAEMPDYGTELEKAVNHQVKLIKKTFIDGQISAETDIAQLNKMFNNKRNIDELYITLTDG